MPRILAIVSAIMLLAGAAVGIVALGPGRLQSGKDAAIRASLAMASDDPSLPPLYDVPKLDKIAIDGSPADWGDRGLRVKVLSNVSGKIQPQADIDATLRLGWNDHGLLALVTVLDDLPVEGSNPSSGDSVELFISPKAGSTDVVRIAIAPGMDPHHTKLRSRVIDLRTDPKLKKVAARVSAARTKIDGGYVLEALIPWSNIGIKKPQLGQEIGFQLQVNDVDVAQQASHLVWFPSAATARDPSKMQRLRLAAAPGPAVLVAAFGDYPRFHRTRITVLADPSLIGKTVEVVRSGSSKGDASLSPATEQAVDLNADDNESPAPTSTYSTLVAGKLEADFIRPELASVNLSMPMPMRGHAYGLLDVLIDHRRVAVVDLPDPGDMAKWILPYQEFIFKPSAFSGRAFPEGDFEDPSYVEDLVGSYETKVTFYDADYHVVTTAEKPGRYGAIAEVRTEDGQTFKRYRSLFREPADFSWRNTEIPFTVKLPKEMGISADALKVQQQSVSTYFKELLKEEGMNRDADTAVLLAGLYETRIGDKSLLSNTPAAMDRAWWAGLKKKLGEPVIKHLVYMPLGYEKDSKKRWPLLLFLHGKGERGDNLDQIKDAALPSRLQYDANFRAQFPAIVIAPQCPAGEWWSTHELAALLDDVQQKYRVDPDRVYVTGMSMGGYGTWALATEFPDRFAAIVPLCGGGDPGEAQRLVNVPVWAFHGKRDDVVPFSESQHMVTLLQSLGGDVKFTAYPDGGHDAWTETYANPELYAWLFSHHRASHPLPRAALIAGAAVPTTLPSGGPR